MSANEQMVLLNASAGPVDAPAPVDAIGVHRRLPGYATTTLTECTGLATQLGLGKVWVKDESSRLGLPSFKILGASYAIYRALAERLGGIDSDWADIDQLRAAVAAVRPLRLIAATDGNHGRAVAHMARLLDLASTIYVPAGMAASRIAAIESEGALVEVVDGDYDAAVRRSAQDEGPAGLVVSDTSWPGYERIPSWVVEGYATIFDEIAATLAEWGERSPSHVVVPVGVGALAAATIRHFRGYGADNPYILGVEPAAAACVLESLRAGKEVTVPGPHTSIMAGLNCGTPSQVAWPLLRRGLDGVVAIADDRARDAMRALAAAGVVAGETGAAALGGLVEVLTGPDAALRESWQLGPDSRVLLLCTEGVTDPEAYQRIVG
ncbi:diaminopropionate ammonia-lyase [Tamaricihabitans halophyticus]|uniref:Diaminopropionate ammonia-lyase n=1 Tax=Tamaricihabitans halophyticus TaxID=1262583 RepID=A0A4R2QUT9_9PSEU|nr:diaminopropionate ammonia-lyase [Tamaricihabitans halophyticus]TCP53487.1 diaminopropionate ammonia-lyase [Tamaricihabitans halophyticus]